MATRAAFNCPCGSFAIKNNPERRLARRRLAADDGVLSFCCGGDAQQRGVSHLCAKACAGLVLAQAVSCRATDIAQPSLIDSRFMSNSPLGLASLTNGLQA